MFSSMYAGGIVGLEAYPVRVEVDISRGLPGFELVGSLGREIKEARERVQIALKNAGMSLPVARIIVNLSPANIRKEGTGYDLAIAAGLLSCMGVVEPDSLQKTAFLGELALDGAVSRVNGVLPIALALQKEGIRYLVVPMENVGEGAEIPGISLVGVTNMAEFINYLQVCGEERKNIIEKQKRRRKKQTTPEIQEHLDFADIYGQESAKRASEVAAAGFHHLLLAGPPGAGKTMIASRIPGILPPLTKQERLEVAGIYSIAGKLAGRDELQKERPFVAPHHTISPQALAGGGRLPRPGMISFSHRGILFLDEMPEFSPETLEVLRQPMEEKVVRVIRSRGSCTYPADFMLIGAMNPCPCGYYPDRNRCNCSETEIHRYLGRISGPILDRIDMVAEVSAVQLKEFHQSKKGESSAAIRKRVMEARKRQQIRFKGSSYHFNGELPGREVMRYCELGSEESHFLEQVFEAGQMSLRAYHKVIKLARTIADLEGEEHISVAHLSEAVCYNSGRQQFWS
ncbi:MAG: YifB family Mg chelatase-like AAA ATPase [Lachnospiraceae bacterium]|nr:YifB family Mg chelatase-like AAA ATPase [Lachnospiraceae bacterium]